MITADLESAAGLPGLTPGLEKALDFLRRPGAAALPDGRYEIDGGRVFAIVQRYETAAAGEVKFEAHRRYTDLQYLAAGAEVIGWAPLERLAVTEAYDAEKDVCFGTVPAGEWTPLRLGPGQLAVLSPRDAHAPRLAAGAPCPVVKIVVKVAA